MSAVIYTLCALTSLACVWFLMGAYARTRHRLLFWSGLAASSKAEPACRSDANAHWW